MQPTEDTAPYAESDIDIEDGRVFDQTYLINKLNYINFIDGTIDAVYRNADFGDSIRHPLTPLPCQGPELACRWVSPPEARPDPASFPFHHLLVSDNGHHLLVNAEPGPIAPDGPRFRLPETCHLLRSPKKTESVNDRLVAQLFQKGAQFNGRLLTFSDDCHDIEIDFIPPQSHHWIDPDTPVYLVLSDGREIYYSSAGDIDAKHRRDDSVIYTVRTQAAPVRRYRPKKYRSRRVWLRPAPDVILTHPLSLKAMALKVDDISSMGFSLTVEEGDAEFIPGLILPDVHLEIAGERLAICKVQVVHRHPREDAKGHSVMRFGMAILDIEISDHTRLQRLLHQAEDPNAYINWPAEQNALWSFFFETGFIYPEKYRALEARKSQVKQTYHKLYVEQPAFARHFIYQKGGVIQGHMAMLRFYSNAWLIHHHAARKADASRAGLRVMEQICQFINESHSLEAMHMDYLFFFYRPENRFPSLLFGKAAQFVDDPKTCSLDKFAYGRFRPGPVPRADLAPAWTLTRAGAGDVRRLKAFYDQNHGGLMVDAFDMTRHPDRTEALCGEYQSMGFKRKRLLFVLKNNGRAKVFFEVNISDIGLNMSDLTNGIKLFLIDTAGLGADTVSAALCRLAASYQGEDVPVLIHPPEAAHLVPVSVERHYMLWIWSLQRTDRYFEFANRILRFSRPSRDR
jgi:hypothetical protein